ALRSRLSHAIRPFVLRRCKSDEAVAADLPPKIELAVKKLELEKALEEVAVETEAERGSLDLAWILDL
ncbi:unnamed protein product, partial [Durusdinium trenchii]